MLEVGVPLTFLLKLQLTCSLADESVNYRGQASHAASPSGS
jgi:hypothetical protein